MVDQIAIAQEQITSNFDRLISSQEQVMHEISKLQMAEQQNRGKNAEPLLATPPSPVPKPIPRSTQTLTVR